MKKYLDKTSQMKVKYNTWTDLILLTQICIGMNIHIEQITTNMYIITMLKKMYKYIFLGKQVQRHKLTSIRLQNSLLNLKNYESVWYVCLNNNFQFF